MSSAPLVTLNLVQGGGAVEAGWTNVAASNGETYGYMFAGGSDGHGNVEQTIGEQVVIYCECIAEPKVRYQFSQVSISNDPKGQLSGVIDHISIARIIDRNDVPESDAEWSINVTDTGVTPACTIPCDPKVTNDPNR